MKVFAKLSPYFALAVAWIATLGSLYLSEVKGFIPCTLCWYQRIAMYPLTIMIAIGILRRDAGVRKYVLPLSIIGMLVSAYHYLEQKTDLFPPFPCQMGISCKADYLNWMGGVVTIPFLALMAFLLITFFMVSSSLADEETGDEAEQLKQPTLLLPVLVTIFVVLVCFGFMKALGV